ncbi:uncharacterized protein LOC111360879 isoform X1 [Spodoptera litura]|uniref:Uncharacterized protein LOC111360879 isoform X1 n=1 Tax=Spodoptera litura TaxID=69820 RepID=A0A9J7J1C0_SPOLT|nr:uncharacterized protein LOC111360879 isoform X1 [Spodoptera litura]XP_022832933.1 uncharacterized protein LOC111360879 isoform X1 [Spodoptera litura]XP_022832934.1 uncharacterized protein LOC111360879 isoform X1 [Spodoptera litura]
MADRRFQQKLPDTLAVRRPLNPKDDFYECSLCPCEEESIQPPVETYHIPGPKVQYNGEEKPEVLKDASEKADKLLNEDIENANQQPSDDDFSDTEPEPPEIETVIVDMSDVDMTEVERINEEMIKAQSDDNETIDDESDKNETSEDDIDVAGPSGLQTRASRLAHEQEMIKKTATNYMTLSSSSKRSSEVIVISTDTDLKTSNDQLDEEPQNLLEKLVEAIDAAKGNVDLEVNEQDKRYRKEVEGDYYQRLTAAASDTPAAPYKQFPEIINWTNSRVNRPLPKSQWGPKLKPLELTNESYRELVASMENILRRLLISVNYDSISNFLEFHNYTQNVNTSSSVYEAYQSF